MALVRSMRVRCAATLAVVAIAVLALATSLLSASATPQAAAPSHPIAVSLEQSATAIPETGKFGYTAHIRLSEPASYLQTRLQIRRPTGKLVYQRTQTENSLPPGTASYPFGRPLEGLDLKPGAYPVELSVRATVGGSDIATTLAGELLIYDEAKPRVPVVLIARVHAQPLSDPGGRLALDPAVATGPRDDVDRIATLVTSDPSAHVTLAMSPAVLLDWKRLGAGYTLADGRTVAGTDPVPQSYAATLGRLRGAIDTGRLELVALGFADPDLTELAAESLTRDIGPQYEAGFSACFASIEASPSTGTVPAGDCAPQSALPLLAERGIGYVAAGSSCVRAGKSAAATGVYPLAGARLNALVTDDLSAKSLASGETTTVVRRTFGRHQGAGASPQPFAIRVDLGDGRRDATSTVVAATAALEGLPWTSLVLAREASPPPGAKTVVLTDGPVAKAPTGFWKAVRGARKNATAMLDALGPGDTGAVTAETDSLLSESSAWAEPNGRWAFAARGLGFADASLRVSRAVLGAIRVKAEPVTFAGAKGEVPVSVANGTQKTLAVTVRSTTTGGIKVDGPRDVKTVLRPQETFIQVPIDMQSSLVGKLRVEVIAGGLVIASSSADVQASYLDRFAVIGGIVVVLGILLAFIVRRVRRAEQDGGERGSDEGVSGRRERYTDDDTDTGDEMDQE